MSAGKQYDDVDTLLVLAFAAIDCKEKKDLRKVVLKLAKKVPEVQRRAILGNVIPDEKRSFKDAKANIWFHVHNYLNIVIPAKEISDSGKQGMVIYEDVAYPVEIFCESEEDRGWARENEHILQLTAMEGLMSKLGIRHMEARVCLFQNRGFTGITETIEVSRDGIDEKSKRIGDSNFFF